MMWSEYTFDRAGSFVREEGVGGTMDLGYWNTERQSFSNVNTMAKDYRSNVLCSALSS